MVHMHSDSVRPYLEGLADFGVVFLQLAKTSKHSIRSWESFLDLHEKGGGSRLDLAENWLARGFGLGFLPRNGLWVLDLDRPVRASNPPQLAILDEFQAESLITGPRVSTPSGGLHSYFRLPPTIDVEMLKNHICHPIAPDGTRLEWDFKLGHRTLLVAPGTPRLSEGGELLEYRPLVPWIDPMVCDPRWIMPELEIYSPPTSPFTTSDRPWKDRVVRAVNYLRLKAPVGVRHDNGSAKRALNAVAAHLVAYLRLDPALAQHLMTHPVDTSWNARVRGPNGTFAPWSLMEIADACHDAVDAVPTWGVIENAKQAARRRLDHALADFCELLTFLPPSNDYMPSMDLHGWFLARYGITEDECSQVMLGRAMGKWMEAEIIGVKRAQKTLTRVWCYVGSTEALLARAVEARDLFQRSLAEVA